MESEWVMGRPGCPGGVEGWAEYIEAVGCRRSGSG